MNNWPYKIIRETPEVTTIDFGAGNFKFSLVPKSDNPEANKSHIHGMIKAANVLCRAHIRIRVSEEKQVIVNYFPMHIFQPDDFSIEAQGAKLSDALANLAQKLRNTGHDIDGSAEPVVIG